VNFPEDVRYTREHEWAKEQGGVVTVGITGYATEQLGDVVFVELPEVGRNLDQGKPFGVVEAVKTVSDLYAPIAGEVVEVNGALADDPAAVNREPYGAGWMVKIRPADPQALAALLSSADYAKVVEEQHG
jgi:glycine cleavage system H protein